MTSLRLPFPIDRPRVLDFYLEGDVWKKIIFTLGILFISSVALNAIEVLTGLFTVQYVGMDLPYRMNKAELFRNLEFMRARERMFHRMYGKEAAWTPDRRAQYNRLSSLTKQYERRYAVYIQTAQAVTVPQLPEIIRTARSPQRPAPRTMPEGVVASVPGRREEKDQSHPES